MEALKRSIGNEAQATKGKKSRMAAAGQKEMQNLMRWYRQ
jgi:hypothetical protein